MSHNESMPGFAALELQKISTILRTLGELQNLRSHDAWTPEQITHHREQSLNALRQFAYLHSPFYEKFHKGYERAPLHELPPVTKSMMMDNFDKLVTDRNLHIADIRKHVSAGGIGRLQGYEMVLTSGSTGNPGIFLFNDREWATALASFARAREWAGIHIDLMKRSKMALVSSTNERNMSTRIAKSANTPFIPTIWIDATDTIETIISRLNEWKPEVLIAYASSAYALALQQLDGKLAIHPKRVFTSSEVLTPAMRKAIEGAWENVVFNEYAATETATIAAEDELHHGLHVFEDLLIIENVDEHNKPVNPGTFGDKLLATVLFNKTQPLIRYEISDSVRFAVKKIPCTLPYRIIDGIQGRQEDVLIISGEEIHPNVFHDVMDATPNKGWRVIQERQGLEILVIPSQDTDIQKLKRDVGAALQTKGVKILDIKVTKVAEIPKSKSGKSPLIQAYKGGEKK